METSSKLQQTVENKNVTGKVTLKEAIKLILKFALVGVIFWLLFRKGLVTAESIRKIFASPFLLLFNILLMFLNFFFSTIRWRLLLKCHQVQISFKKAIQYSFIGQFFNIALPGAVSGDFVKAVYVSAKFKEKKAAILGSILFDRVIGVSALAIVAAIAAGFSQIVDWGGQLPRVLLYSIYGLGFCVVFFFSYLLLSHRHDPILHLFKWLTRKNSKFGALERLYVGIMHYRHHSSEVARALGLSLIIHFFIVTVAFLLANTLSVEPLPFVGLSVIVPIGMLATAIPVLPAGVGTGHAAFYGLFQLVHSSQGAEVFSWIVFFQVGLGLLGGMVYLRSRLE